MKRLIIVLISIFLVQLCAREGYAQDGKFTFNRAMKKIDKGDYQGAIKDFTEAISYNKNFFEAYNYRGVTKTILKDYKGAMEDFSKAIEINPRYYPAYNNRAILKVKFNDKLGALGDYSKIIGFNDTCVAAY